MKIAITGAGGFLGTEILRQLSTYSDITIYAFVFEYEKQRPTFVLADNIVVVDNSMAGTFDYSDIDVLLNCAFPRNTDDASFAIGLDFINEVFYKASSDYVNAVVNISSQSVYSQKRLHPADETTPIVLETKYAVGKYSTELWVNSLFKNVRHTNLRLSSLIGAGFNQRLTNKFASKVIAGEQITITGGRQQFGFMDVRDAADGIIHLLCSPEQKWHEQYNFGTNEKYTLEELARNVYEVGKDLGYQAPEIVILEDDTWQNSSVICDRFYKDFNWHPRYELKDTLTWIYQNM